MLYRALLLLSIVSFALPFSAQASVVLNEIAWMGTAENANDEWIELYNDGPDIVVDGWTISDGGTLLITLSGSIPAESFALLERTDDTTVAAVTAFQIYTGALANDGRTLTLRHEDGTREDEAVGGANWEELGGSNETKETAQRTSGGWVTGTPTPGTANVSAGSGTDTARDGNDEGSTQPTSRSGSGSSRKATAPKPAAPDPEPVFILSIEAPRTVYVHQDVPFTAKPAGLGPTMTNSLVYMWNFGDTYTGAQKETHHAFEYPGEYIIVVDGRFAKERALARHEITVLPVAVSISRTGAGDVVLKNESRSEIDLGNFTIAGSAAFTFPPHTFLRASGSLTLAAQRVGGGGAVALYDTQHTLVAAHSAASAVSGLALPALPEPAIVLPERTAVPGSAVRTEAPAEEPRLVSLDASTTATSSALIPIGPQGAEALGAGVLPAKATLPYIGLIAIMGIGILTLYTRKVF